MVDTAQGDYFVFGATRILFYPVLAGKSEQERIEHVGNQLINNQNNNPSKN